ncbi:MAG: hypothetical protein A2042_08580 [Candidatus Schekmanbacteria bacterium GWA2_38_11]|uniref:DUF2971 domain-containing protein n=1 Tax=Candidatus Schekmanbacteria bacterium GWA2_38_11 TaxID=1817876 RepID=A0A1F7RKZ5_9BACT|nr:MAG: hypothetical protein A2042_08580 [Candidatus Schekmanbacteria bacterium GWA2_38_11]
MLERKKLYLQKVCYWDDPSEGSGYISLRQDEFIKSTGVTGEVVDKIKSDVAYKDSIKSSYPFGTSWSLLRESDAMWRIYSQDKMGVQIQTSVEKLESALSRVEFPKEYLEIEDFLDIKYVVGKVDYNPADNLNEIEHFLIKKEAFKHEEEIRGLVKFFVTLDMKRYTNFNTKLNTKIGAFFQGGNYPDWMEPPGKEVKIIYTSMEDDFIEAVSIDPRADDWIVETIKSYCKSKNITNVERTDLYGK